MTPIFDKKLRIIPSAGSIMASLSLLLLLFTAQTVPITFVRGWSSQTSLLRHSVSRNTFAPERSFGCRSSLVSSSRRKSKVILRTSSSSSPQQQGNFLNSTTLETENTSLRDSIQQLKEENQRLKTYVEQQHEREVAAATVANANNNKMIVLESFEGENSFDSQDEQWCDSLDGDECPLEPSISFGEALRDRANWLVGLLIMQSLSGIILARNELLLANHPVIIYYLTMMVGAGGNAGNQASVRVIRGIALGTLNERTRGQFLIREVKMAATLSFILSIAGFCRTIFFKTPFPEAITVTASLSLIVFTSVCLGAILPLLLERIGVDPAHSSTTIQVVMDILGVAVAVTVSGAILDGPFGAYLLPRLGF